VSLKPLELIQLTTFKRQPDLAALTFFSGGPLDIMEIMPVNNKNKYSRNNVKRQHYLHDVTFYFVRYNVY